MPARRIHIAGGPFTIETDTDGRIDKQFFRGARVGLTWPTPDNPGGYFCILAQRDQKLIRVTPFGKAETGQYILSMVGEFKALTISGLFDKLFDEMGIFGCRDICTDLSSKYDSFSQSLYEYHHNKRPKQEIRLRVAPKADSFFYGVEMIGRWLREIKGLDIPRESMIHSQLREIKKDDLTGESTKFFAINALRYVLAEFEVSDVPQPVKTVEKGISPRAWT